MWDRKLYRAVYQFSKSSLWVEWENIILDQSREDPAADAYEFYQANKAEMLEGVECLWPSQSDDYYHDLMVIRVQDEAAFNSEYQNEPIDPSKAEFLEEWFRYWYELPEIVAVYGAVDPSMGKSDKSDCSSILWLGKGVDNYLYVLKVDVRRRTPDKIIDDIIEGAIEYQHLLQSVSVETVQFQQMFADTLKDKCLAAGLAIDWDEVKPFGEKNNRIRGLIPKVKNGYVLFHPTQVALINEMRRFPKGRDDALDTLQMVVKVALPAVSGFVFGCIDYSGRSKPNEIYRQNL
jgi:predicted phage terminase large subunit-like protein